MKIKSLVRLAVGAFLIHIWPTPSHAAGNDIARPKTHKEFRFETWDDKAAYKKHLYKYNIRHRKFGHLLAYASTRNVNAVLNEPQVQFHLAMLLGGELPHVLDILRDHGEINLYGGWLIFDGRGRGREYVEIQVDLFEAQVEVSLYSGGRWTFYTMFPNPDWIPHRIEGFLNREQIAELLAKPPKPKFRLVSRSVRGNFAQFKQYYGTGNIAPIVNHPELRRVLRAFPGFDFALFYQNLGMHGNVSLFGGWLNFGGGKPHEQNTDRTEVAIDPRNGRLDVAILTDDIWTVYSSTGSYRELNAHLRERMHRDAISDLNERLPRPKFWFLSWQPKTDYDLDAD